MKNKQPKLMYCPHCKGCYDYEYDLKFHYHDYYSKICVKHNNKGHCPCSTCIIKIMCETPCSTLEDWLSKINIWSWKLRLNVIEE